MIPTRRVIAFIISLTLFSTASAQIHIRINQLGFVPGSPKSAIAFSATPLPPDFRIVNATTSTVLFKGQVRSVFGSWGEFEHHAELDFTSFTTEGTYQIEIGSARSPKFTISRTIDNELPYELL